MKKTCIIATILLVGIFFLFLNGYTAEKEFKKTGFLSNYSNLKKSHWSKDRADWTYVKKGVDWNAYHSIIIEPVVFFFADDAEYKGIDVEEMKLLSDSFHKVMIDEISKVFKIVSDSGPGVLRFRASLTDVKPSVKGLNTLTSVIPIGLAISTIKKAATGTHSFVGTASGEGELLDSTNSQQLMAAIDEEGGRKLMVQKSFSDWGHTIDVFKQWAERFRKRVEELRK